jgi:hypothetical protein
MSDENHVPLTDSQIEHIAERAAKVALDKVYQQVGQNVLTKLLWVIGVASLGLMYFLAGEGVLKP